MRTPMRMSYSRFFLTIVKEILRKFFHSTILYSLVQKNMMVASFTAVLEIRLGMTVILIRLEIIATPIRLGIFATPIRLEIIAT